MRKETWYVMSWMLLAAMFITTAWSSGAEPVVIRIADIDDHWGPVVEEFNRTHTDIQMEFQHMPGSWYELAEKLKVQIVAGVAPDIARLGIMITPDFRDTDLALDLMPFIERDASFSLDAYFPSAWRFHQKGDRLAALPVFLHTLVNYANVDRYQQAGLELPSLDWESTWTEDEFVEINEALSTMWDEGVMGTNVLWHPHRWLHVLWRNGASFFIEKDGRLRSGLAEPEAIEAVQWMADLMWEHEVARRPDRWAAFSEGNLGNLLDGTWLLDGPQYDVIEFEWAATPLPRGSAGNATSVYPDPLVILKSTQHPNEAWEVVKFLMSERTAEILQVGIPANREAAINLLPELLSRQPLENKMVVIDSLVFAKAPPAIENWARITEMVEEMVRPIQDGEAPAATILPQIAEQVNLILDEMEAN